MDESAMSLPGPTGPKLGEKTNSAGARLALDTLNNLTPRNQAKPFNPLFPPSRPALASDPEPVVARGSNETVWSISTVFSSLFNGANSGTSSAATSRSNSVNLEHLSVQDESSTPSTISRWSAWSTLTTDLADHGLSEPFSSAIHTGIIYALVLKTAKIGMYRGYVDICQRKMLRDKWYQKLWAKLDPENILEVVEDPLRVEHCQEVHTPTHGLDLDKDLPAVPTLELQSVQSAEGAAQLQLPVAAPSSPAKSYVRSTFGLGFADHYDYNASQVSLSSLTDSFHTAPTRSREDSVTSPPSAQLSTKQSTRNSAALMPPFDSIESRIEPETGPALPGSGLQVQPRIATDGADFDVDELVHTESDKAQEHTDTTLDQSSATRNSCAEGVEHFQKDIRIFHPCPKLMISRIILVRLDSGSDDSFISPGSLKSLGILPDSDLIQSSNHQYVTLGGAVVARGMITLSWRVFNDHDGPSDHDETTFYISPDISPYGALFGQDVLRGLNHINGQPRMNTNFMNLTIPPTKEEKENAEKAKEEHDREVEENDRVKKEKKAAAAARKAASSSSNGSTDTPRRT